jgi:hypothetical protein
VSNSTGSPQGGQKSGKDPCGDHAAFAWFAQNVSFEAGVDAGQGAGVSGEAEFSLNEIGLNGGYGGPSYGVDVHAGLNVQISGPGVEKGWFGQTQVCAGHGLGLCIKVQTQNNHTNWSVMLGGVEGFSITNHLMYHMPLLESKMKSPSRCTRM